MSHMILTKFNMATKMAAFMCQNCNLLWRSITLQNLPYRLIFGRIMTRRKLCSSATESKEATETDESKLDPPAHLLQTKGMGTPVLEEHTPVHPEVAEILRNSRGRLVDGKWIKPLYNARKLAKLRNEYIAKGYYWPQKPMADRGLDRTPKGHKRVMLQAERRKKIAENMAKMPQIIEEYKTRMRETRAKRREEKEKSRLQGIQAQRLGFDIRDPRALLAIQGETTDDKKKKKEKTKK